MTKILIVSAILFSALLAFVALGLVAMFYRRASLRRELTAYLKEKRPDLTVVEENGDSLALQDDTGNCLGTLFLYRVYREAPAEDEARRAFFDTLVHSLSEGQAVENLGEADRAHVMPRIVNGSFLASLRREAPMEVPALPLAVADLSVVFVLDSKNSVAYLGQEQLSALGLPDEASALELAKENLRRSFDAVAVRGAVEQANMNVIKSMDSYDAARLLLVPDYLNPGEELAAMIPDRDTLVLIQVPQNGDWSPLVKLAKVAAGDPLYRKPLRVTSAGIAATDEVSVK